MCAFCHHAGRATYNVVVKGARAVVRKKVKPAFARPFHLKLGFDDVVKVFQKVGSNERSSIRYRVRKLEQF